MSSVLITESSFHGRSSTDIRETVEKHDGIVPHFLAGHALSGADTTAASFGIGKTMVLKVLAMETNLSSAYMVNVVKQATQSIRACYGQKTCNTMSEKGKKAWAEKTSKARKCIPPLKFLQPKSEVFIENVKRAHLQTAIWKCALDLHPPVTDPLQYGWITEEADKSLQPITVSDNNLFTPNSILQRIKCSCTLNLRVRQETVHVTGPDYLVPFFVHVT